MSEWNAPSSRWFESKATQKLPCYCCIVIQIRFEIKLAGSLKDFSLVMRE